MGIYTYTYTHPHSHTYRVYITLDLYIAKMYVCVVVVCCHHVYSSVQLCENGYDGNVQFNILVYSRHRQIADLCVCESDIRL